MVVANRRLQIVEAPVRNHACSGSPASILGTRKHPGGGSESELFVIGGGSIVVITPYYDDGDVAYAGDGFDGSIEAMKQAIRSDA